MKKIKIRFSYFLILGIIGIIFQLISFFAWKIDSGVTISNIMNSSKTEYFDAFIKPNHFVIVSVIFMIGFAVGLILCSKKEQLITKIGGYTIGVSELIKLVITIIYVAYATKHREIMFKEEAQINTINALVNIKFASVILTHVGLGVASYGLIKYQKEEKITKAGSYVGLVANGLLVTGLLVVLVGGIFSQTLNLTNGFIGSSYKLKDMYELSSNSMNGFTYSHLEILFTLSDEIALSVDPSKYSGLHASVIIVIITLIVNAVSIVANLLSLSLITVQSFDVSKDDKPMEF